MKIDFNEPRERANELIDHAVKLLQEYGDPDSDLNLLYYLKDDIRAKIRKVRRANRKAAKANQ